MGRGPALLPFHQYFAVVVAVFPFPERGVGGGLLQPGPGHFLGFQLRQFMAAQKPLQIQTHEIGIEAQHTHTLFFLAVDAAVLEHEVDAATLRVRDHPAGGGQDEGGDVFPGGVLDQDIPHDSPPGLHLPGVEGQAGELPVEHAGPQGQLGAGCGRVPGSPPENSPCPKRGP